MNRRSFLKKIIGGLLTVVGLGAGAYYYARDIEPRLLQLDYQDIISPKIPTAFEGFKIVQFTDTHVGFHYSIDQLKKLVTEINEQDPHVIVFTGDLIDEPQTYAWDHMLIEALQSLKALYGKYWIYGNHDHGGYGTESVKNIMDQSGFKLLKNNHTMIEHHNESIVFAGIDDVILGKPDLSQTLDGIDPQLFTILLAHEPDFAESATKFPIDIQLSGHSHGGQVRFPFIGHLYTPAYAEKYIQGNYKFSRNNMNLYVSRGIGTTRLPFRFLCKPEFSIFTLKKEVT